MDAFTRMFAEAMSGSGPRQERILEIAQIYRALDQRAEARRQRLRRVMRALSTLAFAFVIAGVLAVAQLANQSGFTTLAWIMALVVTAELLGLSWHGLARWAQRGRR